MLSTHRWFFKIFQWILDMHSLWGDTGVPHAVALRVSEGTPGHAVALRVSEGTRGLKHRAVLLGMEPFLVALKSFTHRLPPTQFIFCCWGSREGCPWQCWGVGELATATRTGSCPGGCTALGRALLWGLLLTSSTRAADLHAPNANREEG